MDRGSIKQLSTNSVFYELSPLLSNSTTCNNRVKEEEYDQETKLSSSPFVLNFNSPAAGLMMSFSQKGSSSSTTTYDDQGLENHVLKCTTSSLQRAKRSSQPHDDYHIIAERKRRQKLNERFIAISTLLPGLKKMDKATVLGDAINYVRELQSKVTILEEEVIRKKLSNGKVGLSVKKNIIICDDEDGDDNFPEIEAKICKKDVLIRVQCEKTKGLMVETVVAEIEKLHLSVMNSWAVTFGDSILDITVLAKMEEEFTWTIKDLMMHLRSSLTKFM
ncbi:OLC1v1024505C2 [Oldenlandia corymbosa var. corymbosa]|nr:OLC1v1024505C2 [Oldenlandia corymbosa var. corymbosa]